jgi:hypothetical protein
MVGFPALCATLSHFPLTKHARNGNKGIGTLRLNRLRGVTANWKYLALGNSGTSHQFQSSWCRHSPPRFEEFGGKSGGKIETRTGRPTPHAGQAGGPANAKRGAKNL